MNKKQKSYITYTILFAITALIVFSIFIKNNKGFIWNADGYQQHYTILYDFNQILREGITNFSWDMGLGLDVIGQYSYYVLGDPFAYISLIFPINWLETIYSVLIILRMYCVGLAFVCYCNYHEKESINTSIGAIIYAFCGFILFAGVRHPYFSNAAILLPLTFIGTDRLLKENKKTLLTLIVFISALSSYYFFYMITIVNIIYAITKYIVQYNNGIKDFIKKLITAIGSYIVGILMAGIILLPTIYAFFNSARLGYMEGWTYESSFYPNFIIGLTSIESSNWTVIGISSIIILMIPILFTKIKEKESKVFALLFIITTIMLLIPGISSIMNGFSYPSNRWIYTYSFILSYIVTLCFNTEGKYTKTQINSMGITYAIYALMVVLIGLIKGGKSLNIYINLIICAVIFVIILSKSTNFILKNKQIIIISLIILNINIIGQELYKSKGYANAFVENNTVESLNATLKGEMSNFKEAIEYIKENDNEFYRISKCDNSINDFIIHKNASLIHDYHPIQGYLSIGNGYVYNLSKSLEDNSYNITNNVNGMDRRSKITTLLGTKYYVCNEQNKKYVPYGYELYHKIGDTEIYLNKNNLSLGILYDNFITKEKYKELTPLEREDILLSTAVLKEKTDKVKENIEIEKQIEKVKILPSKEIENLIQNNTVQVKDEIKIFFINVNEIEENTEIYLSIKNLKYKPEGKNTGFMLTTYFNGITNCERVTNKISAYYAPNPDFLINLGIAKNIKEELLGINFNNKGTYTFDNMEILSVPMESYETKVDNLKNKQMTEITYGNNFVKGKIKNDTNGILQLTTSYSKGWKVYVDGKEQEIIKVNEAFIGTIIEKGEHDIEFRYETPYLKIGIISTVTGIICFVVICILEKICYNSKRKEAENGKF